MGALADLVRNQRLALRVLFLLPLRDRQVCANPDQAFLALLLVGAIKLGVELAQVEGPASFDPWGIGFEAYVLLWLLTGFYLAWRALGQGRDLLPALVLVLTLEAPLYLIAKALQPAVPSPWVFLGIFLAWAWLGYARAFGLGLRLGWRRAALAAGGLLLVAIPPQFLIDPLPLWYAEEPATEADLNAEKLFYRQPEMMAALLDGLAPERPGVVDLYHIGFGGDASQKVFLREVGHVRDLLDARFDTAGRSLALVNHRDSVEQWPIASVSNLRLALQGVARRMNTEEDILLLYLTSHGYENHDLVVELSPLPLNPLGAEGLRALLDESGIRWRVVVVSACYSGGFIEALSGDGTLVMTAAAADRPSFGCANENEYTYFGEALVKEALPHTSSFPEAFERAAARIRTREQAEGLEASGPRIAVGAGIAWQLQRLEARLATGPVQ